MPSPKKICEKCGKAKRFPRRIAYPQYCKECWKKFMEHKPAWWEVN